MKSALFAPQFLALSAAALTLSACMETATPQQKVMTSAAAGAAAGALIDNDNRLQGAAIGGVLGTVAGAAMANSDRSNGQCLYRDSYGRQYYAAC